MSFDAEAIATIEQAIIAGTDAQLVTRFVVVAETIDPDGTPSLLSLKSPGLPLWVASGMLRWEADTMSGQPIWTADHTLDDGHQPD